MLRNRVSVETGRFSQCCGGALNVRRKPFWTNRRRSWYAWAIAWRSRLLGWRGPITMEAGMARTRAEHSPTVARQNLRHPEVAALRRLQSARQKGAKRNANCRIRIRPDPGYMTRCSKFAVTPAISILPVKSGGHPTIRVERRLFVRGHCRGETMPLYEAYAAFGQRRLQYPAASHERPAYTY